MNSAPPLLNGRQTLDVAWRELEVIAAPPLARFLAWLAGSRGRWLRIPAGLACLIAAALWFAPALVLEFLSLGLLLLARDVPPLRKPVGLVILFLVDGGRRVADWLHPRG